MYGATVRLKAVMFNYQYVSLFYLAYIHIMLIIQEVVDNNL
jgi:hypothetical protein